MGIVRSGGLDMNVTSGASNLQGDFSIWFMQEGYFSGLERKMMVFGGEEEGGNRMVWYQLDNSN